jgi:hypothetical protein
MYRNIIVSGLITQFAENFCHRVSAKEFLPERIFLKVSSCLSQSLSKKHFCESFSARYILQFLPKSFCQRVARVSAREFLPECFYQRVSVKCLLLVKHL